MFLKIATPESQRFLDELVDVERRPVARVALEAGTNAADQRSCAMAILGDPPERLLGSVQVRYRTVKKAEARVGSGDHRGQGLSHFVSDRRGNGVSSHQACVAFAALPQQGVEQRPYSAVISYSSTTSTMLLDTRLVRRTAYQPMLKRAGVGYQWGRISMA